MSDTSAIDDDDALAEFVDDALVVGSEDDGRTERIDLEEESDNFV